MTYSGLISSSIRWVCPDVAPQKCKCRNLPRVGRVEGAAPVTVEMAVADYIGFSQFTIQGIPKRSVNMPKPLAQNVSWNGI